MTVADLHVHTTFSDSTDTPADVMQQAAATGIGCIGITDHDTIEGLAPSIAAATPHGIEVIPGVELSSEINGKDIHILGYLFDPTNQNLARAFTQMQDTRVDRMRRMIDKLKEFGVDNIELDEVCALADSDSVGRPHLAMMLEQKGWVSTVREAFMKYLAEGRPVYFPKFKQTPQEAIRLIKDNGGIAVLAHPMITQIDPLIPDLVAQGLDGLEVYYPNVSKNVIRKYEAFAEEHGLLKTGGSDAHGRAKERENIGDIRIPYDLIEAMKKRVRQYRQN